VQHNKQDCSKWFFLTTLNGIITLQDVRKERVIKDRGKEYRKFYLWTNSWDSFSIGFGQQIVRTTLRTGRKL